MTKSPLTLHLARAMMGGIPKPSVPVTADEDFGDDDMGSDDAPKDDGSDNNPDRLKVLVDPDAQKLVMKIFQQYVSEEDYAELVMFIKDFDALLSKFRKGKPLSREEIEDIEEEVAPRAGKGKGGKSADTMQLPGEEESEEDDEEEPSDEESDFDDEGESDFDDEEDDDGTDPSIVIASVQGPKPLHEVIGAVNLGLTNDLSIPLIGYKRKILAAYEPKYSVKTGEFIDVPYHTVASRLLTAGYKRSKPEPDATGAYTVVAFGRGTDRIDVYSFGNDENRIVRAVILAGAAGDESFKVCDECTGGTAPACKANGKCLDQQARKEGTGPYAK